MNKINASILILTVLQLTACSSADTESMNFALQKSGLNELQASCYSEQLNKALDKCSRKINLTKKSGIINNYF